MLGSKFVWFLEMAFIYILVQIIGIHAKKFAFSIMFLADLC